MHFFGTSLPLSRERWTTLRREALVLLSIEWFGQDEHGNPLAMLSLVERASHSNFPACDVCNTNKKRWVDFRAAAPGTYTQADARAFKEELHTHINDVKAQRRIAQQLAQECAQQADRQFEYDDGCGSMFMYAPSQGKRESAADASRYQYRFAMMCNLFPGHLLRLSLILPCVVKGGNFGCTAYFSTLLELKREKELASHHVRLTDSGPDNDTATTHAFHWSLIHFGVMNSLLWIRLLPKHSHNFADRVNSMVKEKIWPKRGAGGGFRAPWDFEDIMKAALASQRGKPQFAWHLANIDWTTWFSSFDSIGKDFALFSGYRVWKYEYAPDLPEHGFVRVTYKESLTTVAGSNRAEWKPFEHVDGQYRTKPEGLIFMQDAAAYSSNPNLKVTPNASFPKLSRDPGVDKWKLGKPVEGVPAKKTWKQEKVFSDILEHRMVSFPEQQQQQWHAMKYFHDTFPTADTLPPLPITLPSPNGTQFTMQNGSPLDWNAAWEAVAWIHDRPHKPSEGTSAHVNDGTADNADGASSAGGSEYKKGFGGGLGGRGGAGDGPASRVPADASVVNGVTGANNTKLDRKHAAQDEELAATVRDLPAHGIKELAEHKLHFAVAAADGEFRVCVVKVDKLEDICNTSTFVRDKDNPMWGMTPTLTAPIGRVTKTKVPRASLLAVPVLLTDTSYRSLDLKARSVAGQSIKLSKKCMTLLREFLKVKRPDLIKYDTQD